ncbi:MAG: DMT family transporter [Acidobacteriota bacterium]
MQSRWLVLAAALLFSTGGAAIKSTMLTSWQTAGLRSAVAAVALYLLLPQARRLRDGRAWLVGIAYALTLVFFVQANKLTTSANAIFLQSTAPAYLLVLGPLLLHEKPRRRDLIVAAALACGMALFLTGSELSAATAPDPRTGNLWAAASGLTYAFALTGLRWQAHYSGHADAALSTITAGNVLAALLCLPRAMPIAHAQAIDWAVVGYLGIFQIGVAYWCLTRGMRDVPAFEASILLLAEPVLNPVWTWLWLGERPGAQALAGGAVILAATFWKAWSERGAAAAERRDPTKSG